MKRTSIEFISKLAVVLLFVLNKNVCAKENEDAKNEKAKDETNTLISLKDWFEWVSDPTSKCRKYDDNLKIGMFN